MSEIKNLVTLLKKASTAYYNGEPIMDDATFDAAFDKLKKLDPKNPFLKQVGKDASKEFEKRQHVMPMGSQQKAKNPDELQKWWDKGYTNEDIIVVNHKMDGISVELQYKSGKLLYAVTRGDGDGDDITKNVIKMQGVPIKIDNFDGAVRGEIIMNTKTWKKKYEKQGHKMPRTTASGISKRPDGVGCKDLQVIVYDVFSVDYNTESEKIEFLMDHFDFVAPTKYFKGIKGIIKWYKELIEQRKELDFEIDGIVIKCNKVDLQDMKRDRPKRQIALKFPPTEVTSKLLKVVWNVSGTIYTPVGHIEPVLIDRSTVRKANLCNPGILRELGLCIGSTVSVVKRGDIIPKIESVIEIGDGEEIKIPTECLNCGEKLVCTDTKLFCPNEDCSNKLLHQIGKWIEVLDIKEFGDKLLKMIFDNDMVTELADLYSLQVEDLGALVGEGGKKVGIKNAQKAMDNLQAKNEISLSKFIAGFDISGVGEKLIELLMDAGFNSLKKIRNMDEDQMTKIKGIGEAKAKALVDGLIKYQKEMNNMNKIVKIAKPMEKVSGNMDGKSVCFTGKLSRPRKEMDNLVLQKGGTCKNTVCKGLTYLVTDTPDSGSAKNQKAQAAGVEIINESRFMELFG